MISILILTRNEEKDLPGCLDSVVWSDDVHVFDSFSTDQTVTIAESRGAVVTQRVFDGYASQRNASLKDLKFKYPWVLILDADERIPAPSADEMRRFVSNPPAGAAAGRLRRRDFLLGTWLKHAQISPFYIRLVKPELVHYEREINEVLKVDGAIVDLAEPFDHHPFSKGFRHWIDKHNTYSTMEAGIALAARRGQGEISWQKALFARDFNQRRYYQKEIFYRLPARPLIKWFYMMFVRRALLDGKAGLIYSTLQAIYEYFIVIKTRELELAEQAGTAPSAASISATATLPVSPNAATPGNATQP
jgi:glycosyltransferase involved in cell wall biosynthesis